MFSMGSKCIELVFWALGWDMSCIGPRMISVDSQKKTKKEKKEKKKEEGPGRSTRGVSEPACMVIHHALDLRWCRDTLVL